jgi:predicted nucleotidyltransferase
LELFRKEEDRFDAIVGKVREAVETLHPKLAAAWIYGSVARGEDRPTSDLDVAVVATEDNAADTERRLREALQSAEDELAFQVSVIALGEDDIVQLAAQNDPLWTDLRADAMRIFGDSPDVLLEHIMRAKQQTVRT